MYQAQMKFYQYRQPDAKFPIVVLSVFCAASGQSGLLHHNGGKRQEGDHGALRSHGEEPSGCSHGGSTGQPFSSRQ